jgi:thioredoxin 1
MIESPYGKPIELSYITYILEVIMAVIELKSADFENVVLKADKPVLIDFWATWCGPCQMQGPIVEEFAEAHPDAIVCKLNVDDEPDLAEQFNIMSIPSLLAFKGGELIAKSVGVTPAEKLAEMMGL